MSHCQVSYEVTFFKLTCPRRGKTITRLAVEMTAKTNRRPVPTKPALLPAMRVGSLPLSRMTMQTHVILSPDASGPLLRLRARVCVCVRVHVHVSDGAKKKEKFLTYTGWNCTVQKFI